MSLLGVQPQYYLFFCLSGRCPTDKILGIYSRRSNRGTHFSHCDCFRPDHCGSLFYQVSIQYTGQRFSNRMYAVILSMMRTTKQSSSAVDINLIVG